MNMWRTRHFTLQEFIKSDTAEKYGIDNTPPVVVAQNLCILAAQLEVARGIWQKPIIINSGYRCDQLNQIVGGVNNSFHKKGLAADIRISSQSEGEKLAAILKQLPLADAILLEHKGKSIWLHFQIALDETKARHLTRLRYRAT